ncbi:MAG: hypothetical protein KDD64_02305 [Bdellovibrionales bacterium]|nr:hypothetical protein [Bdellovibrionales bacterium]
MAKKNKEKKRGRLRGFIAKNSKELREFAGGIVASIALAVIPLPIGPFRHVVSGGVKKETGRLEFPQLLPFMLTCWFIFFSWLSSAGWAYNGVASNRGWWTISESLLTWPWLGSLLLTLLVMGDNFRKAKTAIVFGLFLLTAALIWALQAQFGLGIFDWIGRKIDAIPVEMKWGIPLVAAVPLGLYYAVMTAWQRVDDVWRQDETGNLFDHHNLGETDESFSKGAKTFVADFKCLLKRYLFFGYGYILVKSLDGKRTYNTIGPVFFAMRKKHVLTARFATTDTVEVEATAEAEQNRHDDDDDREEIHDEERQHASADEGLV